MIYLDFRNIFYFFSLEKDICVAVTDEKYIGRVVQFIKYDITIIYILKIYI